MDLANFFQNKITERKQGDNFLETGTADDNISFSGYRREICGRGPVQPAATINSFSGFPRLPCAIRCTRERRAEWVPTLRDFAANSVVLLPPSSRSGGGRACGETELGARRRSFHFQKLKLRSRPRRVETLLFHFQKFEPRSPPPSQRRAGDSRSVVRL